MITLKQASVIVELSPDTLRKYIFDGRIKGVKMGRDWFLSPSTIKQLQSRRRYDYETEQPDAKA